MKIQLKFVIILIFVFSDLDVLAVKNQTTNKNKEIKGGKKKEKEPVEEVVEPWDVDLTEFPLYEDEVQQTGEFVSNFQPPSDCQIYLKHPHIAHEVNELKEREDMHLLEYSFVFSEYAEANITDPLSSLNLSSNFRASTWFRVLSMHGKSLLRLAFNYNALSLNMFRFGVQKIEVELVDDPPMCFGLLHEREKLESMYSLLLGDFMDVTEDWSPIEDHVCHQVVRRGEGDRARFAYECCTQHNNHLNNTQSKAFCAVLEEDKIFEVFYTLIIVVKLVFYLMSPYLMMKLLFNSSTRLAHYIVPLDSHSFTKTMLIKRVPAHHHVDRYLLGVERKSTLSQFVKFRKLVKSIPSDEMRVVSFSRLDILVDEQELLQENESPISLLKYFYNSCIKCSCLSSHPLKTCCLESLVGSWTSWFLCIPLRRRCGLNISCRDSLSWGAIMRMIGAIALVFLLPLPFLLRLASYAAFESNEVRDRRNLVDHLKLDYVVEHDLVQWLTPTHPILLIIYAAYACGQACILLARIFAPRVVPTLVKGAIADARQLRRVNCVKMLLAHLLLPFEKFGLCGIVVAIIYWPIVLPLCILISLFYCIPMFYMTGRLLIHERPDCLGIDDDLAPISLSGGISSFTSCFLLGSISPGSRLWPRESTVDRVQLKQGRLKTICILAQRRCGGLVKNLLLSLCTVVVLHSLMLMYAESFGFVVEVVFLSLLGAVMNAGHTIGYVVFGSLSMLYAGLAYYSLYSRYRRFADKLFATIRTIFTHKISALSQWPDKIASNFAFKFEEDGNKSIEKNEVDTDTNVIVTTVDEVVRYQRPITDSIEYIQNKLHWKINSLIFFIDTTDKCLIPRSIFWDLCNLDSCGSPGPLYKSVLKQFVHLLLIYAYLGLLGIIAYKYAHVYAVSSINEVLILLICGCAPLVILLIATLCCRRADAPILPKLIPSIAHDTISTYPVFDLVFQLPLSTTHAEGDNSTLHRDETVTFHGREANIEADNLVSESGQDRVARFLGSQPSNQPIHVDLLITLRDEPTNIADVKAVNNKPILKNNSPAMGHPQSNYTLQMQDLGSLKCNNDTTVDSACISMSDVATTLLNPSSQA